MAEASATTLRVAAAQHATTGDVAANLATGLRMVDEAVAQGAQLVVLPEFGNHPSWYDSAEHAWQVAIDLDGEFTAAFRAKAAEHGVWVMFNATVRREPGRITDTNVLCAPDGSIAATSDKQVLMGGEREHISEATEVSPLVAAPFGTIGLYSCMDGVILETPRALALRGAHLLLNSLNSFAHDEGSLHIPVRAPENRVWIVAANKVGPLLTEEATDFVSTNMKVDRAWLAGSGESQIVAPDGTVVAKAPRTGECIITADIDVALGADKRRPDGTDVFAVRRPELYAGLGAAPRGQSLAHGVPEAAVAVVQPAVDADTASIGAAVAAAVEGGARLVVLPELAGHPDGTVRRPEPSAALLATLARVAGEALVVTSVCEQVGEGWAHTGVAVGADGVVHRQRQLHATARHPWVTVLGDGLEPLDTGWCRLAVVVGDDAVIPETVRLAGLAEVEVVALPFTVAEPWELEVGLVERAAENRLNLVAASRPGPAGAGAIITSQVDFTLWAPRERPFDGMINMPDVVRLPAEPGVFPGVVRPAATANRLVSRGTDVVDGRPWQLVAAITG